MNHYLSRFVRDLRRLLKSESALLYQSRMKRMSRIQSKERMGRRVNDAMGVRIVYYPADGGARAYHIARRISDAYPGTTLTRDYVKRPKPLTNYQSLHLQVPYMRGGVEVQVRDVAMHAAALLDGYHQ